MSLTIDYLSIWEVAHRWHNEDPNLTDLQRLPLPVQDSLRNLTRALAADDLHVLSPHGTCYQNFWDMPQRDEYIPQRLLRITEEHFEQRDGLTRGRLKMERMTPEEACVAEEEIDADEEYFEYCESKLRRHRKAVAGLDHCYGHRIYDREKLESIFVGKYELFRFCHERNITPPEFWYTTAEKADLLKSDNAESGSEKKLRSNQLDRLLCQAIARTLWDAEPTLTIADLCTHPAILRFGNGAHYQEKTRRSWLSEVDPRPESAKRGRPRKR